MSKKRYTRLFWLGFIAMLWNLPMNAQSCSFFVTPNPSCGGNTGSIDYDLNVFNPCTIDWSSSNGQSGQYIEATAQSGQIPNLSAGIYTLTMTDAQGCVRTATATILDQGISVGVSLQQADCNGQHQGILSSVVTGSGQPFNYFWSDGQTGTAATGLAAGIYWLTVSNSFGCSATTAGTVPEGTSPQAIITGPGISCNGLVTTWLASNGANYAWSTGETTAFIIINPSQTTTYSVTVSDAVGCSSTASKTLLVGAPPAVTISGNTVLCNQPSTVITANSPTAIQYLWSTGVTTQSHIIQNNAQNSTITVTVVDAVGCTNTASVTISRTVQVNVQVSNLSCQQGSNGSVTLTLLGGTAPYGFLWSDGSTMQNRNNIASGSYTVTITDSQNCTGTASAFIGFPAVINGNATAATCGQNNGEIQTFMFGGAAPFVYLWSTGATTADLNNLAGGTYTVTVTDNDGCTKSRVFTVAGAKPILTLTASPSTCGNNNGSITCTVTGGVQPYSYAWSNGQANANNINLSPGTYTVTVTDATGCTTTASATLTNFGPLPPVTITNIQNPDCGASNGQLTATVIGGLFPFTYQWSNLGQTTATATGLPAGTYTVTATDVLGCSATASATLSGLSGVNISMTTSPSTCGNAQGTALATPTGGTQPYNYLWSAGGQTTELINGLAAGNYTVTVTDQNGCTKSASAFVSNSDGPQVSTTSTPVFCFGGSNGTATSTASGGTPGYTYVWSNNQTTTTATGLTAGSYWVTASDATGCSNVATVVVTQPSAVSINATAQPSACGVNNGSITTIIDGGVPNYTFAWSNTQTTATATGLAAGTYTVTVTDANGCTKTASATVINLGGPTVTASATTVSCFGANNGTVTATAVGGTPGYTYAWSNGSWFQTSTGLSAGTYTVTVTDANGCTRTANATVTQPTALTLSTTITPANCSNANGSASAVAGGGTPGYSYNWSNNATSASIQNLVAGTYIVTVTDANGCTKTATAIITTSGALVTVAPQMTRPYCGEATGAISSVIIGGTPPLNYNWSSGQTTATITGLTAGTYTLSVSDAQGCSAVATYFLSNALGITLNAQTTNPSCGNIATGGVDITVTGGFQPLTYLWSNSTTTEDLNNVVGGNYSLTITDVNACTEVFSFNLTQPAPLFAAAAVTPVSCPGGSNGSAVITVSGGIPPYTFQWPNCPTCTFGAQGLTAGAYTVTITDAAGCSTLANFTVTQPPAYNIAGQINQACGSTSINLNAVTGGTPPYAYLWSNGVTGAVNVVNTTGNYVVTLTDANGCTSSKSWALIVIPDNQCAYLSGSVVKDDNKNCANDGESGLANWIVRASGNNTFYALTDANGFYLMGVETGDIYTIEAIAPGSYWYVCPGIFAASPNTVDTLYGLDLPVQDDQFCPELEVSMVSGNLRRCFSNNYYALSYCNNGTATAEDAYLILTMDAFTTPQSSSVTFTNLGNNNYRFNLGDVDPGECNSINVIFKISCNAVIGQSICATAHIYPDSICTPPNALWSGASLVVDGACSADSLRFSIINDGFGPMSQALEYIVVEDHVMRSAQPLQLASGQSHIVSVPANGSTWRVSIPQEAYHPGNSKPSLTVEGCTQNGNFSTGFMNQFAPNDDDPWIDIYCQNITGSFDPNDKQGLPEGYGTQHYIDTAIAIQYLVRFQNTGNDTAFTVQILDTLSQWLDPSTIKPGAASHPYRFDLRGQGVASFTFDNILLPDSTTNEPASHGFVSFDIYPRKGLPLETVIENQAAIYFDFNEPIFTNTTWHRIGDHFLAVGIWQPQKPEYTLDITPNPTAGWARISVNGLNNPQPLTLSLLDQTGRLLIEQQSGFGNNSVDVDCSQLPSGIYGFYIRQDGRLLGSGKLIR